MGRGIVEIRDYTIEVEWLARYKVWAEELAAPWLKKNLDIIDFWMDMGLEAEVSGSGKCLLDYTLARQGASGSCFQKNDGLQ